jgi:hypothetical protein
MPSLSMLSIPTPSTVHTSKKRRFSTTPTYSLLRFKDPESEESLKAASSNRTQTTMMTSTIIQSGHRKIQKTRSCHLQE